MNVPGDYQQIICGLSYLGFIVCSDGVPFAQHVLMVEQLYSDHFTLATFHLREIQHVCRYLHVGHRDISSEPDTHLGPTYNLRRDYHIGKLGDLSLVAN